MKDNKEELPRIVLQITVENGHVLVMGAQGAMVGTMTTDELNRLTLKKMCNFIGFTI